MPKTPKMSLWVHCGHAHRPKSGFTVSRSWQTTRRSRSNIGTCIIATISAPLASRSTLLAQARPNTQWVTCAGTIPPQAGIHTRRGGGARERSLGTKVPTRYSRPSRRIASSEPAGVPRAAAPRICALCVCVVAPPRCSTPNSRRLHTLMRVSPLQRERRGLAGDGRLHRCSPRRATARAASRAARRSR